VQPSIWYQVISCVYHFDSFQVTVTPPVRLRSGDISANTIILIVTRERAYQMLAYILRNIGLPFVVKQKDSMNFRKLLLLRASDGY